MGTYFHKPVQVSLGNETKASKNFKTYGDFCTWAHRAFSLQGSVKTYVICRYEGSKGQVTYHPSSDFDNPTRVWLKAPGVSYEFSFSYDLNGLQ